MNSESNDQVSIKAIFLAAREKVNLDERRQYLQEVCGDDESKRQRVERMLTAERIESANPLDQALENFGAATLEVASPTQNEKEDTRRIGPYKLLQKLGEGGMGEVYVAEQTEPVHRQVAIKLIKRGMDSREVVARFEAERQALAMMNHPNIARILEAGETVDGCPYFVMDLVRGIPINEYCDQHRLNIHERLELFRTVCEAVQHAHHKGVIHRDLKPSNILVELHDVAHVPKVIDFGVAKATNQRLTERTLFTNFHQMIGTPLYMSPEQAELSGLDVDTRSDVYSLGVLLYELLTGTTPFDKETLREAGFDEMRRMIREDDPPCPSHRISTLNAAALSTISEHRGTDVRRLKSSLMRELDWIAVKAMEKDRSRRYESPSALAADVTRFLNSEPIVASPPSITYKARKFAKRHRVMVTSVLTVASMFVLALVAISWMWNSERLARQESDVQRELAQKNFALAQDGLDSALAAVDQLLTNVSESRLLNEPHMESLRRRLLEDALTFCRSLAERTSDSPQMQRQIVDGQLRLGRLYELLGEHQKANVAYREAATILESLGASSGQDKDLAIRAMKSWVGSGRVLGFKGLQQFDLAEQPLRRAIQMGVATRGALSLDYDFRSGLAAAYEELARLLAVTGHQSDADLQFESALQIRKSLVAQAPSDIYSREGLAKTLQASATVCTPETQVVHLGQAEKLLEDLVSEFSGRVELQHRLAQVRTSRGSAFVRIGKKSEAANLWLRSRATFSKLASVYPSVPSYVLGEAVALQNLVDGATASRDPDTSGRHRDYIDESIGLLSQLVEGYPTVDYYKYALANAHGSCSNLLLSKGANEEATRHLRDAKTVLERLVEKQPDVPEYRLKLASVLNSLAVTAMRSGNTDEALRLFQEGIRTTDHVLDLADSKTARQLRLRMLFNVGFKMAETGKLSEAETIFVNCSKEAEALHAKSPKIVSYEDLLRKTYVELGGVYHRQSKLTLAEDCKRRALGISESFVKRFPDEPLRLRQLGFDHLDLAEILSSTGASQARDHYQEAGRILNAFQSPSEEGSLNFYIRMRERLVKGLPGDLEIRYQLAVDYGRLASIQDGSYEARISVNEKGLMLARQLVEDDPDRLSFRIILAGALINHGMRLHKAGRIEEAKPTLEEARAYCQRLAEENPDDEQCQRSYALSLGNLGDYFASEEEWSKAVELARKAIELQPNEANHWGSLGVALYRTGDFRAAAQTLEKARQMRAGKDLVHQFFLAMTYWQLGDMKKARELYGRAAAWFELRSNSGQIDLRSEAEELLGLDAPGRAALIEGYYTRSFPKNPTPQDLVDRGDWFRKQGSYDKAIESLTEAIELDPDNSGAYHRRALSHNFRADFRAAISDASQVIRLRPSHKGAYAERAWANIETGNYEQAIADCSEAIRLNPKWFWGYVRRSRAYHLSGRHREAVRDAKKAIDIDPASKLAYEWLADAHIALGQLEAARQAYHERLKIEPDHFSLWPGYCELLVLNHDLGEYRRFCRALLQRHAETKKPAVARAILKSVIVAPDAVEDWAIVIRLAELAGETGHVAMLARAGKFDQAIEFHNALIAQRGGEPNAWNYLWLAMIEHGRGNQSKARELLSEGIKRIDGDSTLQDNLRLKLWRQEFAALIEPKPEE